MSSLFVKTFAQFSPCGQYRYRLGRRWSDDPRTITFLMLNPSTATAEINDPTVGRCEARAQRDGYGGFEVVNLFALKSTDPSVLRHHPDPVGPGNDVAIEIACVGATTVVCAWGAHGSLYGRDRAVLKLLDGIPLYCLGVNKGGTPKHPLYLRNNSEIVPYRERKGRWDDC